MTAKHEYSFGIIPLKKRGAVWYVLLVQLYAGHWGFPKGHLELGETALDTARRELFEETGLNIVELLTNQTLQEEYFFKSKNQLIHKKVTYYIAQVQGSVKRMKEEIKALKWVPLSQAVEFVSFEQTKKICQDVITLL